MDARERIERRERFTIVLLFVATLFACRASRSTLTIERSNTEEGFFVSCLLVGISFLFFFFSVHPFILPFLEHYRSDQNHLNWNSNKFAPTAAPHGKIRAPVVLASPYDLCSEESQIVNFTRSIALAMDGNCTFLIKVRPRHLFFFFFDF